MGFCVLNPIGSQWFKKPHNMLFVQNVEKKDDDYSTRPCQRAITNQQINHQATSRPRKPTAATTTTNTMNASKKKKKRRQHNVYNMSPQPSSKCCRHGIWMVGRTDGRMDTTL